MNNKSVFNCSCENSRIFPFFFNLDCCVNQKFIRSGFEFFITGYYLLVMLNKKNKVNHCFIYFFNNNSVTINTLIILKNRN